MSDNSKTILVVDDDPNVRSVLRRCLASDGYEVLEAETSDKVVSILEKTHINLITLDLNLGAENGLDIAASIRASSDVPIIMVTGKDDVIDKVVGLELGADDYISKPFHIREVLARVHSVIRRYEEWTSEPQAVRQTNGKTGENTCLQFERWFVDPEQFEIRDRDGCSPDLTSGEFNLLVAFLKNPKRVLSRDQLMDKLNGQYWLPFERAIDNQISRLRKKLESDPAKPTIIKTVRGVGYLFAADVTQT